MRTKEFGNARGISAARLAVALPLNNRSRLLRHTFSLVALVLIATSASGQEPVIITQPPPSVTVTQGGTAFIWIQASNSPVCAPGPVTFQWFYNGSLLRFATNDVVAFVNAQPYLSGFYSVQVYNACGSVISQVSLLRVEPLIRNVSFSNEIFGFSFDSNAGRTNTVECVADLATNVAPSWTAVWSTVGNGSTVHFSITNSVMAPLGQRRFYRVRVE